MSFILDALRKSENERQREASPSFARAPVAVGRRETPGWTHVVMGILAIALVVLAVAWWRSDRVAPVSSPAPAADDVSVSGPAPSEAGEPAVAPAPAPVESAAAPRADSPHPIGDLAVLDPALPVYSLEFVAYDPSEPGGSSAWINGSLYRPGERLRSGPELVEVRSDSVILGYRGETFLLRLR
jgi:general secretion pathway protein B